MGKILAIGDCNTLGVAECLRYGYPERVAERLDMQVINCACTMATTREGLLMLRHYLTGDITHLFIQFGLVDSYKTFKYSPYVLYYPDNFLRKQVRSLVKKYKKTCRNIGLNERFGEESVVGIEEYERNVLNMVTAAQKVRVFLIDTIPNKQLSRNTEIQRYNNILLHISQAFPHCLKIDLYEHFHKNLDEYYFDETHSNEKGYEYIVEQILNVI